jgi:hypothetical protein
MLLGDSYFAPLNGSPLKCGGKTIELADESQEMFRVDAEFRRLVARSRYKSIYQIR